MDMMRSVSISSLLMLLYLFLECQEICRHILLYADMNIVGRCLQCQKHFALLLNFPETFNELKPAYIQSPHPSLRRSI